MAGAAAKNTSRQNEARRDGRMANVEWVCCFDNALRKGTGLGLTHFKSAHRILPLGVGQRHYYVASGGADPENPEQPPRRCCVEAEDGRRWYAAPVMLKGTQRYQPTLHMCTDLGPIGFPAANWLVHKVGLRSTLTFDMLHRRMCDLDDAVNSAGLRILKLELKTVLKIRQGPFLPGGANHSILRSSAEEMFSLTDWQNNLVYELLYDSIVAEGGYETQGGGKVGSDEHKAYVWEVTKTILTKDTKGDNTKTSRWWNFEQNSESFQQKRSMTLLNLIYLGFRRKWWQSYSQCPLNRTQVHEVQDDGDDIDVNGGADDGADDGGHADGVEGPSTGKVSGSMARAEVQRRRQQTVNTLHFATSRLCVDVNMRLWKALVFVPAELQKNFMSELVPGFKTQQGVRNLLCSIAQGADMGVMRASLHWFESPDFASGLGFSLSSKKRDEVIEDSTVAECSWKLLLHMIGNCMVSTQYFMTPPQCFVMLSSPDPEVRAKWVQRCKAWWESLCMLDEACKTVKEACDFRSAMLWPLQQWASEVFITLADYGWERVPQWLQDECHAYSLAHSSTLIVENLGNACRSAIKQSPSGRFSARAIWHTLKTSATCVEHDRPPVVPTQAARSIAQPKLPKHVFSYQDNGISLGTETLKTLTQAVPTWPALSAASLKASSMASLLLERTAGNWDHIRMAWLSQLLPEGCLVTHTKEKAMLVVMHVSQWGFLGWRVTLSAYHGLKVVRWGPDGADSLQFRFVADPTEWLVAPLTVHTPCTEKHETTVSAGHLVVAVNSKGTSLLRFAAMQGFRNLTATDLKKLWRLPAAGTPDGPVPTRTVDLVTGLVKAVSPGATDAQITEALQARGRMATPESASAEAGILNNDAVLDHVLDELEDDDLKEELKALREKTELPPGNLPNS